MKIQITELDIEKGVIGSARQCPIARAMNNSIPYANAVVGLDNIFYGPIGNRTCVETPSEARDWMEAFDHEQSVKPCSFEL